MQADDGQTFAQVPQWEASLASSTSQPLSLLLSQSAKPERQLWSLQMPPEQVVFACGSSHTHWHWLGMPPAPHF
jgi:hypothetical protein